MCEGIIHYRIRLYNWLPLVLCHRSVHASPHSRMATARKGRTRRDELAHAPQRSALPDAEVVGLHHCMVSFQTMLHRSERSS